MTFHSLLCPADPLRNSHSHPTEDGGGPLDASCPPCEIGQLGKRNGQGGAFSHLHKSSSTTPNCKQKKWSSAPVEWELPLGKPKAAFEGQRARQPSPFPACALLQQTGWPGPPVNRIILRCTEVMAVNTFLTTAPCLSLLCKANTYRLVKPRLSYILFV